MMDIEKFREYCLGLGEVSEKMPFGKFARRYDSILAFYVCGHMFCFIDVEDFNWVNIKSTPSEIDVLRSTYTAVENPLNQSLRHWIRLSFKGDIPDDELYRLVSRAFDTVKSNYSKRKPSDKA